MKNEKAVAFGSVGLGGYGHQAIGTLLKEREFARLVAVFDPNPSAQPAVVEEIRSAGVRLYEQLDEMLADREVRAVWLPAPIDLHRQFTEAALSAGKAVLCEKPAAGCIDDVDAMIAARDRAGLPAVIAFQAIYQPRIHRAKQRLLDGAIGEIRHVSVVACWPRTSGYFHRNDWAGALKRRGRWVLDSPANNAASHYINQALFLLGPTMLEAALPLSVEAELYRANPIENYDTCAIRAKLDNGATLCVYMTHACRQLHGGAMHITGSKGSLHCERDQAIELTTPAGTENLGIDTPVLPEMVHRFCKLVNGDRDQIVCTLENARAHSLLISGASDAVQVRTIPEQHVRTIDADHGATLRVVEGLEQLCRDCASRGELFHESGLTSWTAPAGRLDLKGYRHFAGTKTGAAC